MKATGVIVSGFQIFRVEFDGTSSGQILGSRNQNFDLKPIDEDATILKAFHPDTDNLAERFQELDFLVFEREGSGEKYLTTQSC